MLHIKHPHERNVNTVFQNYALFPHMNVYENIAFGLSLKKMPKKDIKEKVTEMLKMVQLEGFETRMPNQLSGGQRQRVAIARAVANNPKVLLLDEPLGALDLKLRKQMQIELKHLQRKLGITFIFVTHDQEEALTMSDRIVVMNNGRIEQVATPEEIYEKPATKFVADFIGETNLLEGKTVKVGQNEAVFKINTGEEILINSEDMSVGEIACVAIRPERIKFSQVLKEGTPYLSAKFKERIYTGSVIRTIVTLSNGKEIVISENAGETYDFSSQRQEVFITWNFENAVVMKA